MVYDDARWNKRLRRMGCWNESEARNHADVQRNDVGPGAHVKRTLTVEAVAVPAAGRPEMHINGSNKIQTSPLDQRSPLSPSRSKTAAAQDGFQPVGFAVDSQKQQHDAALSVLKSVRSVRGHARQEYGKVYEALSPFYRDALNNMSTSSLVFQTFTLPEQQAQMLRQINLFARSDFSPGAAAREEKLNRLITTFNSTSLLEFHRAYEQRDIQGRMRQYAQVMHLLDGGQSSVDLFIAENKLVLRKTSLGSIGDCVDYSMGHGQLSLERVQACFERLGNAYAQEAAIVHVVFPQPVEVLLLLLAKIADEVLSPFLAALFEDAQSRSTSTYLRVISGTFAATKTFVDTHTLGSEADRDAIRRANDILIGLYQAHIDTFLAEEYGFFKSRADKEIEQWDQSLSEQDASTESFLMSNVNRQAQKKDFMSSFKKVVMAPVNILPRMSGAGKSKVDQLAASANSTRPSSPALSTPGRSLTPTLPAEAPTSELAAKAALMESKLENIKSLFSVEVALNLVHAAKSSLERAAQFISLKGELGEKARQACANMYLYLLDAVGNRHVKSGLEKAISHLSSYNPRESHPESSRRADHQPIVAPLTTFLELVNVGDLIQQMLDVFFESELIAYDISRRDDFLDPPVKEKRRFESMLDEHVATGLGKGIDVLMDEVEFICATEQPPTDYNPALFDATSSASLTTLGSKKGRPGTSMEPIPDIDISPTPTTLKIISLISVHHTMLTGTTDKTLLDVFTTELGLRLFQALAKHIKRQRISPLGAIRLLSDLTRYSSFVATTFRNQEVNTYFTALQEVGQIFLLEGKTDKEIEEMSNIIADQTRYGGVFGVEEVVEFVERRSDWIGIRGKVEGKIRGEGCNVM